MRLDPVLLSKLLLLPALWAILGPIDARGETVGEEVVVCEPACADKQCGDDGCGGSCGNCSPYHLCQEGTCSFNGGCAPASTPGCGGCTCEACTCANDPYCCTGKWDALCVSRCGAQCGGCGTKTECGDGVCEGGESCGNCVADCGKCPLACGAITSAGCCAESTLLDCDGGELIITNCLSDGADSCGWDPLEGEYVCGGEGADPAGTHPLNCPAAPPQDVVEEVLLPEACNGLSFVGCCDDEVLRWCDAGGLHSLDCATNPAPFDKCGWNGAKDYYDCGGDGVDPSGEASPFCPALQTDVVIADAQAPECKVGTLVAQDCETIPWEGCCDAAGALFFCESGKLLCKLDCSGLVYPSNTCGWHAGQPGYYDCGGEGSDPAGEFPYACPLTEVPVDVVTQDVTLASCEGIPDSGCCEGTMLHWCVNGLVRDFDCGSLASDPVFGDYVYCGSNPATDAADCLKKPDPSPPACVSDVLVEPPPEPAVEMVEVFAEVVEQPDKSSGETVKPEVLAEVGTSDGSGLVIPPDGVVEPEPKSKKDGCAAGAQSKSVPGWLLIAALALLALAGLRNREVR